MTIRRIRVVRIALLVGMVALSFMLLAQAKGGVLSMLFGQSIRYELRVTDEGGQPISAATVWILRSGPPRPDLKREDMLRLISRHAQSDDVEFIVPFKHEVHRELEVYYTDGNGVLRITYEKNDLGDQDPLPMSFAGIKRGYVPTVVSEATPVNASRTLVVKLVRLPAAEVVDQRLLAFDRLRAESWRSEEALGSMSKERAALLKSTHLEMRALAEEFEREGKSDQAAMVYYNLAHLPSVLFRRGVAGDEVVAGYANSFDKNSPQAVADIKKARQLNSSNPQMLFDRELEVFVARGVMDFHKKENYSLRVQFIQTIERYLSQYPGRMYPSVYDYLVQAYNKGVGDVHSACKALNRFHHFEPGYYDKAGWEREAGVIKATVELEKWREMKKINPSAKISDVSVDFKCQVGGQQ